ncbi:MAG: tryptophan-rich sensory protein, partial [Clostridia bacterium]|nr:tryptophan-rich sensory protein [Clostridia bacterium]
NIVWSMVFFTFNNMFLGVVVLVLIIISAYFLVKELYLASKTSLYLALPYFIWLFYAFLLNYAIYFLN